MQRSRAAARGGKDQSIENKRCADYGIPGALRRRKGAARVMREAGVKLKTRGGRGESPLTSGSGGFCRGRVSGRAVGCLKW